MKKLAWFVVLSGAVAAAWAYLEPMPFPCLLGRHDGVLTFGDGEIFLRCTNCMRRSSGWQLGRKAVQS